MNYSKKKSNFDQKIRSPLFDIPRSNTKPNQKPVPTEKIIILAKKKSKLLKNRLLKFGGRS